MLGLFAFCRAARPGKDVPERQLHSLSSIAFSHTYRGASRAQIPFTHPRRPPQQPAPPLHATRFHPEVNLSNADLHEVRRHLMNLPGHQRPTFVRALLERSLEIARATPEVFTTLPDAAALGRIREVTHWQDTPLSALPVTVKDLFDVEGEVTTAGSRVLGPGGVGRAPARRDATAVARLRAAGATLFGRTNMSEFAFSGVGVNPHFGTPPNPADTRAARIPGGSTSGGAVSVANGCAWVALGSDTGGSLRIPAALCGVVGFKSTARLVSGNGAFPLAPSLDTVGAITRSVRDAALAHQILSGRPAARDTRPLARLRLAVVRGLLLQDLDDTVSRAYARALSVLSAGGAQLVEIELPELDEVATQAAALGTFPAAECHALHRGWLDAHNALYDPRVLGRIRRGASMLAADYLDLLAWRADWQRRVGAQLQGFDAVLSPTVPMVAPPLAQVAPGAERDEAFFRTNGLLLRNPTLVNLLDGCALSLPCHRPESGELPVGLMLWHTALQDDGVLHAAALVENTLRESALGGLHRDAIGMQP